MAVGLDPTLGHDAITLDAQVEANAGCRTSYSTEVGIGEMVPNGNTFENDIQADRMEDAKRSLLAEMRWRAESIGPHESEILADDSAERGPLVEQHVKEENDCGEAADVHMEFGVHVDASVEDGVVSLDANRSRGADNHVYQGEHTATAAVDEHSVDDMYA